MFPWSHLNFINSLLEKKFGRWKEERINCSINNWATSANYSFIFSLLLFLTPANRSTQWQNWSHTRYIRRLYLIMHADLFTTCQVWMPMSLFSRSSWILPSSKSSTSLTKQGTSINLTNLSTKTKILSAYFLDNFENSWTFLCPTLFIGGVHI